MHIQSSKKQQDQILITDPSYA